MAFAYLDVDDEITSAAARIRGATERELALVLPAGSRLGTSRINFRLLAREAASAGRDLAIVSPDPATRSLAASAGLPAYATVVGYEEALADAARSFAGGTAAEADGAPPATTAEAGSAAGGAAFGRASVRGGAPVRGTSALDAAPTELEMDAAAAAAPAIARPRQEREALALDHPRRGRRGLLVGLAGVLVVALLVAAGAFAAFYLLPTATVAVVVQPTDLAPLSMTISADPAATTPDAAAGVVPAERRTFPLTVSATFAATGKKVTETKATGVVRWENCDPTRAYDVMAGTIVRTKAGVAFTTDETLFLPVAILSGTPITITCQTRDVGVTSVLPGTDGNVTAGTITVVPANLNSVVVRVANPAETTGGTHVETTLVAKKDVDAALKKLNAQLDAGLAASLKDPTVVGASGTIFPATASRTPAVADQDTAALVGQQVSSFDLALTSTGSVLAVDTTLVSTVAEEQLRASVPAGEELVAGSAHVAVGKGTVSGGKVTFPATATAQVVHRIDPATIRAAVRGKSLADARIAAAAFGTATVTAWPDFVSTIPTDDSKVTIDISYAGGPTEPGSGPSASPSGGSGASTPPSGSGSAGTSPAPSASPAAS